MFNLTFKVRKGYTKLPVLQVILKAEKPIAIFVAILTSDLCVSKRFKDLKTRATGRIIT